MFVIEGVQADAEFREQHEMDSIVAALRSSGYRPVLRSMLEAACDVVSVSKSAIQINELIEPRSRYRHPSRRPGVSGDIFFKENLSYVLQPMEHSLYVWEIRHHGINSSLSTFCDLVESKIKVCLDGRRVRGMNFTWRPIKGRASRRYSSGSRFYQEEKLETKPPEFTEQESNASKLLVSSEVRDFMLRLAQVGKARASDTVLDSKKLPIDELLSNQLVRKEFLVLCRKDSHTICSLRDPQELSSKPGAHFACTVCGRPFKEELIQEIYALSDLGKGLISGSRWMTIWVTDLLAAAGISKEHIAWNPISGEDELDIMTDALGPRVFFELKDREFGLGDAYPFAYRVSRYGGAFGIVVTSDKVAGEAKKFFKERGPSMTAQIIELEGAASIEKDISEIVDRVSRTGVMELLAELAELLPVNPIPIITAWMDRVAWKPIATNHELQLPQ